MNPRAKRRPQRGFTLLEVLIAVGILSVSLTSLLSSQMASLRATQYAQSVTAAAFLADYQLTEIEWKMKRDGWGKEDREFDGTFSELGWPDIKYKCLVDFLLMPEYGAIQRAQDRSEQDMTGYNAYTVGEQALDAMGMVWTIVKSAIEQSIRKSSCTVYWKVGNVEHEFQVSTFWTDPAKLQQLPQFGGEADDEDGKTQPKPGQPGQPGTGATPGAVGPAQGGGPAPSMGGQGIKP